MWDTRTLCIFCRPIGLFIRNQCRRRDFSGGRRPGHFKAITRPPAEGPGAKTPDGSEVSFLKLFKVLENESIFQKYHYFFLQKSPF